MTDPTWSVETLLDTLTEAQQLARIRGVGPDRLEWLGTMLPAVVLPDPASPDAPAVPLKTAGHDVDRGGLSHARVHPLGSVAGVSRGRAPRPAVNTRSRLEGLPLSADLQPALSAEVADPLWLLCRQWQFLEFAGEDAGTPIDVRVEGERAQLSRYLAGSLDADSTTRAHDYVGADLGLETAVEAEPVRAHHARLAVEAGVQLQWTLNVGRLNDLFAAAYPYVPVAADAADRTGAEWQALAGTRSIDARALFAALTPLRDATGALTGLPPEPVVPAELQDQALERLGRWVRWYETALVDPSVAEAWNPARQEYAFAVSAQTSDRRGHAGRRRVHRRRARLVLDVRRPGLAGSGDRPATTGHAYRPAGPAHAGRVCG